MNPQPVLYQDRVDAGKKLGRELKKINPKDAIVLAIPSGGVPVGKEVAEILGLLLGLIIVRKIQYPWTTESGFGAMAADGTVYLQPDAQNLSPETIRVQVEKTQKEVIRREKEFDRWINKNFAEKTVILVDDGLAAGSTMMAAVLSVKKQNPKKIIVAIPTASADATDLIKPKVNELVSLYTHPKNLPFAVASSYKNWHDLDTGEVKSILSKPKLA
jgi:putative phosphoribosyl transferase